MSKIRFVGLDVHAETNRGWKGDVPVVRLNTDRIKSLDGSAGAARNRRCACPCNL
jgi:hypothetical protein